MNDFQVWTATTKSVCECNQREKKRKKAINWLIKKQRLDIFNQTKKFDASSDSWHIYIHREGNVEYSTPSKLPRIW